MCVRPRSRQAEGLRAITGAIVSHHTGNRDAEVRVVGDCGLEEGDRALLFLVRKDLREGHPGSVVDADVDELPPDAPALVLTGSIAGDGRRGRSDRAF